MIRAILITVSLVLAMGCGKKPTGSGKPKVAVSIFPLYDVTRRIAGDRLEVILVLPPGKSEHGYDPAPKEIARLEGTKLGFAVGLDMDGWVENIMRTAGGGKIIRLGDKVKTLPIDVEPIGEGEDEHDHDHVHEEKPPAAGSAGSAAAAPDGHAHEHDGHDHGHHDGHDHGHHEGHAHGHHDGPAMRAPSGAGPAADAGSGSAAGAGSAGSGSAVVDAHAEDDHGDHHHHEVGQPDPHFWLDPTRMSGVIDQIEAELAAIDPAGKDVFAANAKTLKASLAELDGKIAARSKAWTRRTIVTFHGSMAYFAKRYGIRIAAVVEPIAGKEPTAAYIAEVLEAIKRGKAAALFTEPQLDRSPGEMIAKEAGIPLGELDPVGGVSGRDSYEALLTWNTDQLEKALK